MALLKTPGIQVASDDGAGIIGVGVETNPSCKQSKTVENKQLKSWTFSKLAGDQTIENKCLRNKVALSN